MLKKLLTLFLVAFICLSNNYLNAQAIIDSENFNTNTSGDWTAVSVLGATDVWTFGTSATTAYASMNGFGDENDEDWLVSPEINMDNSTGETFNFKYRNRFSGPMIELYYTTNYTGSPTTTTWTAIPLSSTSLVANNTSTVSPSFTPYTGINISALTGTVRFAFKYFGTSAVTKEWQIDDIEVLGTLPCVAPTTQATTFFASPSNTSATISWAKGDGSNSLVLVNTSNSFTAPIDGTTYTPNTIYGSGQQTVYTGTGTSVTITGLTATTTYYVQIYNFQTCVLPIDYITASPLLGSLTTTNIAAPDCATFRATVKAGLPAHNTLGYNTARARMYGNCDNQNNTVTCVYGGAVVPHTINSTATSITIPMTTKIINAEHTIPQSFFSQADPMVSDMCHLFPTYETWNGVRSNFPFSEIPDAQTTQWHILLNAATTSIPSSNIGSYSEAKAGTYEPREIQKGNTARAIFYFYTVYGDIMNNTYNHPITDVGNVQMLYNWHIQDPVTAEDITRNDCIKSYQGNGNPYIDHPEWVAQAFGCGLSLPVELISFEGKNKDTYNALTWKTASEKNAQYFLVERKDNEKWIEIGRVKAVGNSAETQHYTLEDINPLPLSIYRLQTVDVDGTESVSKIITIARTEKAFTLNMFPNPAKDFVTFRTNTTENQAFNVTITDISGRILIQKNYDITSGGVDNHINISALSNGIYFFTFDNGIRKKTERFVRQ